jgi:transcriptional regulator of acetoin/glycerol metabolism
VIRAPRTLAEARRRRERAQTQADDALEAGLDLVRAQLARGEQVNVKGAADELGVSRNTLYSRIPALRQRSTS